VRINSGAGASAWFVTEEKRGREETRGCYLDNGAAGEQTFVCAGEHGEGISAVGVKSAGVVNDVNGTSAHGALSLFAAHAA